MRWAWISIIGMASVAVAAGAGIGSKDPDLSQAAALYQRTQYTGTIRELQALDRKNAAGYALLGKAYFMQGQYKEAVASLEKAIEEDRLNSDHYDWLGKAYGRLAETSSFLSALGHARKTVRAFEQAVELGPTNLEALSDLFEYYLQAPGMVGGGVDKAENIAARVSRLDQAEHHWMRARLAEKRKDYTTAEREFRAALAAAPDQPGRALDLAAFLSSRGRYVESETLFESIVERHPNTPNVLFVRASTYIQSNRKLRQAQALLEKYLEAQIAPDDPPRREAVALLKTARDLGQKTRQGE